MKVLAIDDQKIVLLYLKKCLTQLGYEVQTATCGHMGISMIKEFQPDLVMVDINVPSVSGLLVVEYIRQDLKSNVPIAILSGQDDQETVLDAFNRGANDFIKKPVSLKELSARVKALLKNPKTIQSHDVLPADQYIQEHVVGVVIPCYNEEKRLPVASFRKFLHENLGFHFCFVNDGSTDQTNEVLLSLKKEFPYSVSVYHCQKNVGKAEAVRKGALFLSENSDMEYIGYLDADLSTDLSDFKNLLQVLKHSKHRIVGGSRMLRMGADISKNSTRALISKLINLLIRFILKMPHPLLDKQFHVTSRTSIDRQLLTGASIFGIGWGLAGLCPGPAIASLAYGRTETVIFLIAMFAGLYVDRLFSSPQRL